MKVMDMMYKIKWAKWTERQYEQHNSTITQDNSQHQSIKIWLCLPSPSETHAPAIYYKCIAQIAEKIIEFWKSKTRTINKNDNRLFDYLSTSLVKMDILLKTVK